jgi:carbon monoxide dehydrogenase subunit G
LHAAVFTRSVAVVIARPPDEVFAFVSDARNRPMGREYEIDWEIAEHEPPTHQRIESTSGPFSTTLVYDLATDPDGTTVRFSVTGRPTGALRLMQPLIARTTQRNLDQGFARLKEVLEGGS